MKKIKFILALAGVLIVVNFLSGCNIQKKMFESSFSSNVVSDLKDLNKINFLKIDSKNTNINILQSDVFKLEHNLDDDSKKDFTVEIKDDNLFINCPKVYKKDSYLNISVPSGTKLESCNVNMDVGNFVCESSSILGENFEIKSKTGNLKLLDANFKNLNVNLDAGNVKISGKIYEKADIFAKIGNIDVDFSDSFEVYNFYLKSSLGNIYFNGKQTEKGGFLESNYVKNNGLDIPKISAITKTGNINMNFIL